MRQEKIILHDKAAFTAMRKAGSLAAEVLDMITDHVTDGVLQANWIRFAMTIF